MVDFLPLKKCLSLQFFLPSLVSCKWNTSPSEGREVLVTHLLLLSKEHFNLHMNPVLFFGFQPQFLWQQETSVRNSCQQGSEWEVLKIRGVAVTVSQFSLPAGIPRILPKQILPFNPLCVHEHCWALCRALCRTHAGAHDKRTMIQLPG